MVVGVVLVLRLIVIVFSVFVLSVIVLVSLSFGKIFEFDF